MNRHFFRMIAAAALAMMLSNQAARAQDWSLSWLFGNQDPRLTATGIIVGAGSTAGYFALRHKQGPTKLYPANHYLVTPGVAYGMTTIGCAAAFPIVGTLWLNRPLTTREVYRGMADCVVPFVGSWAMDYAFHGQAWYEDAPVGHHHH
jgi:hypothetical protein